jgi:hypothetical protein
VLINGLGLGIAAQIALAKPKVSTVIEISEDVIELVAPHIADDRLKVINANARKWMRWHVVWHEAIGTAAAPVPNTSGLTDVAAIYPEIA